jgi:hypothetical protein
MAAANENGLSPKDTMQHTATLAMLYHTLVACVAQKPLSLGSVVTNLMPLLQSLRHATLCG